MKINTLILFAVLLSLLAACNAPKNANENEADITLGNRYNYSIGLLADSLQKQISTIVTNSAPEKSHAIKFLYAYMSLNDKLDYSPDYYSNIVDATLKAKSELSWGATVPEELFLHFVLPIRSNTENLDTARPFFYQQLKNRIANISMLEAAMEVNHWCHEHVSYQASDGRTSSPLTTYWKGYGRCGEESVFAVAGLRSVGIPARQVYTPRWAHTDDNHAWVEFWADGKWYFYGACEPQAEPNQGWFTEPARRAMMVSANAFGPYQGNENILFQNAYITATNSLRVYADTKELNVRVQDQNGKAVENATVEFQIYNYAEFYTLYKTKTNQQGMASFETGLGDLLLWASTDSSNAYKMVSNALADTVILQLAPIDFKRLSMDLEYNPPILPEPLQKNQEKEAINNQRLAYEDSLQKAYELTFVDSISATNVANLNKIDAAIFWKLIKQSRANGPVLIQFIESSSTDKKQDALKLLQAISEKDLRDMTAETLLNHLKYSIDKKLLAEIPEDIYYQYILNPRIGDREFIWPWRNVLIGALGENLNAEAYFNWVKDNIQIDDTANYSRAFINPASSFRYGIADEYSRDILLLALWRSNGIPARYETGTGFLQYYKSGEWHTLSFEQKDKTHEIVYANLQFTNKNKSQKLEYYKHFTIAKLEGGKFETVEYEWDKDLEKFPKENKLSPGYYRLCTGNRMPDGSVAVHFSFFELKANELTNVEVGLSVVNQDISKLGMLDNIKWLRSGETKNACTVPNKSIKLLLWFKANNEPSKHALESISKLSKTLVNNNVILLLISENHYKKEELDPQYFGNLPEKTELYIDEKLALLQQAAESMHSQWGSEYPYVLLINDNNEIVYKSEGYKIGIEADLKLIIDKLNDK